MIHHCWEGMPTYEQIRRERNPPYWEVVREGQHIEKEMRQVREAQRHARSLHKIPLKGVIVSSRLILGGPA